MIKEHDRVVLRSEIPEEGLKAGDVGTVVHVHKGGEAAICHGRELKRDTTSESDKRNTLLP